MDTVTQTEPNPTSETQIPANGKLISIAETRKILGISHETWRRHMALDYYPKLRFSQAGPTARPKVFLQSVYDQMADMSSKKYR